MVGPRWKPSLLSGRTKGREAWHATFSSQLDNKNIGTVFVAFGCFSQLVFPVGREHEEASIL
jgi:hypothetical protein